MEFQTDKGANLIISFDHLREEIPLDGEEKTAMVPYHTKCSIKLKSENETDIPILIGYGEAACSIKDNFPYSVGRKIAMARALKEAGLNKSSRKNAWVTYNKDTKCNWSVV